MFERQTKPELMDGPDFGPQEVADTFRFLEPVNRWFGGWKPVLSFFQRESRAWDRHRTYRLLDVGCGAGDVPIALVKWSRRSGYRIQIDAIDKNPSTVELARQKCQDYPEISLSYQDFFHLDSQEYDYVLASQFIHHFPDEQVPPVLKRLLAMCRYKLVVNDLIRSHLAYSATWLFTLLTSAVFRHDARISVRRGFTLVELERLLRSNAFHNFRLSKHFFYRFMLIMSKGGSS
jgi:SAM-dependent methyltransferase